MRTSREHSAYQIRQRLVWQWGRRLRREYESINCSLLGSALRPAVLEIAAHLRLLGRWDVNTRTISIGLRHIEQDPWVEVIETLKHEMAHQYVDEALDLHGRASGPHGHAWRQACHRLGIEARATAASTPRTQSATHATGGEDARLRKVRKLLALSGNNPNENEVQAALDQAHALMLRYNLDLNQVRDSARRLVTRWAGEPLTRVERYRYGIASILDEYFFVRTIWVPTYIPESDQSASQLELCGEEANTEMAAYIHDNLLRQLRSLWQHYRVERGAAAKGLRARNSYFDGLLSGFRSQLKARSQQTRQEGLIWVGDPRVEDLFRRRNPRIHHTRVGGYVDPSIRNDGVSAGRNISIARPVAERGNGVKGYLGS